MLGLGGNSQLMSSSAVRALVLASMLLLILWGVSHLDRELVRMRFLSEGPPVYAVYFALRMAGAVVLAMTVAMLAVVWNGGTLFTRLAPPWRSFSFVFALLCVAGASVAAVLLAANPVLFNHLALEDSYSEWSSALALLGASVLMLISGARLLRRGVLLAGMLAVAAGVVLFVTAMEEISWMQRVLGFQTPAFLVRLNIQGEANFHNLDTGLFENLYYGGVFVLLVLLPSLAFLFNPSGPLATFSIFLPSRYALLAGALGTSFCYEMWNIFWMQLAFFYGVLLLGALAGEAVRLGLRKDALLFGWAALTLVAGQLAILDTGSAMVRRWDDTEFKELIIAAGLFLHAAEVFLRARRAARPRQGT